MLVLPAVRLGRSQVVQLLLNCSQCLGVSLVRVTLFLDRVQIRLVGGAKILSRRIQIFSRNTVLLELRFYLFDRKRHSYNLLCLGRQCLAALIDL